MPFAPAKPVSERASGNPSLKQRFQEQKADAAFTIAVSTAQTMVPLLVEGAMRALTRNVGPFKPQTPGTAMPGTWSEHDTQDLAMLADNTATSGLTARTRQQIRDIVQAPRRLQRHIGGKAADLVFDIAYATSRDFLKSTALHALSSAEAVFDIAIAHVTRHNFLKSAELHVPRHPAPGEIIPGSWPKPRLDEKEHALPTTVARPDTGAATVEAHAQPPYTRSLFFPVKKRGGAIQRKIDNKITAYISKASLDAAKLVAQGSAQALERKLAMLPVPSRTSDSMPGALPEHGATAARTIAPATQARGRADGKAAPSDSRAALPEPADRDDPSLQMPGAYQQR